MTRRHTTERRHRTVLVLAGCALGAAGFATNEAGAQNAAFCHNTRNGSSICAYATFEQCLATMQGLGGSCSANPSRAAARPAPERPRAAAPPPQPRDKVKARHDAPPTRELARTPPAAAPSPASSAVVAPVAVPPATATRAPAPGAATVAPSSTTPFEAARQLVIAGHYQDGIAALRALGYDDHPDIAALIGLANLKLRRGDEARRWFERALAAEPNNATALAGSGVLLAEAGDLAGARANLDRLGALCAPGCAELRDLQQAITAATR